MLRAKLILLLAILTLTMPSALALSSSLQQVADPRHIDASAFGQRVDISSTWLFSRMTLPSTPRPPWTTSPGLPSLPAESSPPTAFSILALACSGSMSCFRPMHTTSTFLSALPQASTRSSPTEFRSVARQSSREVPICPRARASTSPSRNPLSLAT